tara:strand:- start:893 stop:2161 length:1269 start_codon:yes stop_codon:yes gene_type:complete
MPINTDQSTKLLKKPAIFNKCYEQIEVDALDKSGKNPFFQTLTSHHGTYHLNSQKPVLVMSSNDYLGLATHEKTKTAAINAISIHGTGCSGSRLLNGSNMLHNTLEVSLADYFDIEAAIVFSTGYQANLGVAGSIASKDDIILVDKLNHASIYDGCNMGEGTVVRFKHKDLNHLERMLNKYDSHKCVVYVDGVFSMEGDVSDVAELEDLCLKYNAGLVIDDAHGVGVLGKYGLGTIEFLKHPSSCDILVGTFSKSIGGIGGFAVGDYEVIRYLKYNARSFVFTAALDPGSCASAIEALNIMKSEPLLKRNLWENTINLANGYQDLGVLYHAPTSPILPIFIGDESVAMEICHELLLYNVYVSPVVYPAVPKKQAMLRTNGTSLHTTQDIHNFLNILETVLKRHKIGGERYPSNYYENQCVNI